MPPTHSGGSVVAANMPAVREAQSHTHACEASASALSPLEGDPPDDEVEGEAIELEEEEEDCAPVRLAPFVYPFARPPRAEDS